jgi:hypothetical protein
VPLTSSIVNPLTHAQKEKNPKFKERMQGELTKLDQASKAEDARRKSAKLQAGARGKEKVRPQQQHSLGIGFKTKGSGFCVLAS